jgi:hypothetical protein
VSRRAKLLITALFLVLLGIPLVYVISHWHPEDPLRFRLVGSRVEQPDPFGPKFRVLTIEVENTSGITILANGGYIFDEGQPAEERKDLGGDDVLYDLQGRHYGYVSYPPYRTIRRETRLDPGSLIDEFPPHLGAVYYWSTPLRDKAETLRRQFDRVTDLHFAELTAQLFPFRGTAVIEPLPEAKEVAPEIINR